METGWSFLRTRMSDFNRQMDRLVAPGRRPLVRALYLLDVGAAFLLYGASVADYFACEFYKKRHCERRRFITIRRANWMFRFLNDPQSVLDVRDKSRFHKLFADLTGREYLRYARVFSGTVRHLRRTAQGLHRQTHRGRVRPWGREGRDHR